MTGVPGGMLVIWNGITAEGEGEYYRWHDREHIPERLTVPGYRRGRRLVHLDRPREYLTVYETAGVDTLGSAPYLDQLARPTDWSQRISAHFRDMVRMVFRVAASAGRGEGGVVLVTRLAPATGPDWAGTSALARLAEQPGVTAAHVLEHEPEATRRIGGQADDDRPWLLLVEGAERALQGLPPLRFDAYRLQISLDAG